MPLTPANIVPPPIAQVWVDRWRNANCVELTPFVLQGFLIPKEDLVHVMSETGVEDVRTYFGLDDEGGYKMLIVGVDELGNDMVDPESGHYIYDFTQPCPPECSTTSFFSL